MNKFMYVIAVAAALLAVGCKKEKIDPTKPSITWNGNPGFAQVEMTGSLDAVITINAPGKIQDLKLALNLGSNNNLVNQYIKIESNKSKGGSNPVLDLVSDEASANLLNGLGMRVGSSLRGREEIQLNLQKILDRILLGQPVDNNTTFSVEVRVTDQADNSAAKTAKFHFTAAPEITWPKNPSFAVVDLDVVVESKVNVWAPGKIEKMTVTLEEGSGAAPALVSYVKNRTTGATTVIDLVGDSKVVDSFKGWFPAGNDVSGKEQVVLDFGFMFEIKYDLEPSTDVFTITVEDKNGKATTQQVQFKKKII